MAAGRPAEQVLRWHPRAGRIEHPQHDGIELLAAGGEQD